ncbi:protein tyrosine kinase, partial [Ostertagia ostertagi]
MKTSSRVISVLIDPQNKNELIPLEKRATLIKNIVIMHKSKKFWIDPAIQFDTLASLFEHYQTKSLLVDKESILLKRGVGLCRWEFKHSNVQVGRLLGRGAYGEVRKGTVIRKNGQIVNVAVKTGKKNRISSRRRNRDLMYVHIQLTMTSLLTRELIREIMKEARIMRDLHHVNVVAMIGVVLIDHPLYILLEYVSGGALDVYLRRKQAKISKGERLAMMIGIAQRMATIHKAIIHRDLAARNCLYDRSHTVKISDFGLSRPGTVYKMKSAQKMPIKWMAPESILTFTFTQIVFTPTITKTNVLNVKVLTYEIFAAIGPYDDMRNSVVKKMIVEGKVNQFPASTPDYVMSEGKTTATIEIDVTTEAKAKKPAKMADSLKEFEEERRKLIHQSAKKQATPVSKEAATPVECPFDAQYCFKNYVEQKALSTHMSTRSCGTLNLCA